ncbi:hypothetical protein GQ43DRAFT_432193 [Delitschia confertaspora ATCC 74209]|uniref:Uncharacterized protein n=1 Tax=Delitschia confertaspora ATCC 74209 TaxID=1513339 RepID=A0A9P4MPK8_9PLEO|nr:hypothetical protein GQ43DRAFT_432193 [Delitschia confertaspora ATCC 74209]
MSLPRNPPLFLLFLLLLLLLLSPQLRSSEAPHIKYAEGRRVLSVTCLSDSEKNISSLVVIPTPQGSSVCLMPSATVPFAVVHCGLLLQNKGVLVLARDFS